MIALPLHASRRGRFGLIVSLLLCVVSPRANAAPHFPGDRPIDVEHIRLDLDVDLENAYVRAKASLVGVARRELSSVALDAVNFQEIGVEVRYGDLDGERPNFEYDDKTLMIPFDRRLNAGDRVDIIVTYTLDHPERGLNFFAPSEESPETPYQLWSQGQSTTNRYWVPCFDHPNEMQTTEISCTVARPYIAISNGRLLNVVENEDDTRTYHWKMSEPHVAYLMALVVGEFAHKSEMWGQVPLTYYVRSKFESWIDNSFSATPKMLDFFSRQIGVDYPWEKYDQVCCYNFGGDMENTTCTILGESTLHDDRAHLDTSSDDLVSHELAHQWFGDLLTCNEWAHLWLNEGFATYFEALWDEERNGADEFAFNMLGKARSARNGGKDLPVVYPEYRSSGQQFDARAYSKGAWILHMIRRRLGDERFWKAINAYVRRYEHRTVETRDFQRVLEETSGESFARFFYDWTARAGHPVVSVDYEWLPDDMMARITVRQTQSSEAFSFPLKLELRFADAAPRVIQRDITDKRTIVYVSAPSRPVAFRVDPDQAVLMELREDKPLYLWEAQLTDDAVPLRMAAVTHLAEEGSDASVRRLATRLMVEPFWGVQVEIAERLGADLSEQSQHGLLNALTIKHPKALAAVVEALGEFDDEPDVVSALEAFVRKGHESYRVEAAAIDAYSSVCPTGSETAIALFRDCLSRDSYREMIREAAFRALAKHGDADVVADLLAWTGPEKSTEVRCAAIRAIGDLVTDDNAEEASSARAIEALREILQLRDRQLVRAAIDAAGQMREAAKPLASALRRIADSKGARLARAAKRSLDRIEPSDKDDAEVEKLRDELKALEEENGALREKVEKLEAARSRSPEVAGAGVSPAGGETTP